MNRHSQKGSALLIVLGFLSFMVVSAVAFAVWMRNERLPSSALRRSVSTRYLVKAALAHAMSRVDDAVRSHLFPGGWCTNGQSSASGGKNDQAYRDRNGSAYDFWEARVFMPPDPEGSTNSPAHYAPASKTVSVLNLEALGYLPPAIINDVRLLARSSWAAQWDYFNFEAGRYAFCAVDVSDMLDISKLAADSPRTSAAAVQPEASEDRPPPSRFSLAYLFRNGSDFSDVNGGEKEFDDLIHARLKEMPLVSIMDYNLAIGTQGSKLRAPFCEYVKGNIQSKDFFYGESSANYERAERQPFVTTSWFPSGDVVKSDGTSNTPLDLSLCQPFKAEGMKGGKFGLDATQSAENLPFWETMRDHGKAFCLLDQMTLFDYLDEDDVPLSLAMPCTERVPMITALELDGGVKLTITPPSTTPSETKDVDATHRKKYYDAKIKIEFTGRGLGASLVYPFKDGKQPVACTAQAFARLVFVREPKTATDATVTLRNSGFASNFRPLDDSEWTATVAGNAQFKLDAKGGSGILSRKAAENCLLVTLPCKEASWTPPASPKDEDECRKDVLLEFQGNPQEVAIVRRVETWDVDPKTKDDRHLNDTSYEIALRPFDRDGRALYDLKDGKVEMAKADFDLECSEYVMRPYLVAWARVVQEGKTVDMVPATYEDDKAFNGLDNASLAQMPVEINMALGNSTISDSDNPSPQFPMPIMCFRGKETLSYADVNTTTPVEKQNEWEYRSCFAVDPRFNWAPENWWFDDKTHGQNRLGNDWHTEVFKENGMLDRLASYEFGNGHGRADRANDSFLFVSNLGYLQSVGELAFLPHLSDMTEGSTEPYCVLGESKDNVGQKNGLLYNGTPRTDSTVETMPCALAAWKSYQSFRTNPDNNSFEFGANLYRRGLVNGSQGYYVSPYTKNQEVMLAALANAPLNYWVAGTNYTAQGKTEFKTFNDYKKFMFSDSGSGYSRIRSQDINKIATFLRHRFEDLASMVVLPQAMSENDRYVFQKMWEDMYDALDWGGATGSTVEDVYKGLARYYGGSGADAKNYREGYANDNGYLSLNKFSQGGDRKNLNSSIRLDVDRAIHKQDEFGLSADPFRGQHSGSTGNTECSQTLYDVDRTFLYSYWRDCFANRQQLFLIFVRAESTALGGTGEGTPAQQGGRAVALVWRDPMPPTQYDVREDDGQQYWPNRHPHKMRVLFYRQFD